MLFTPKLSLLAKIDDGKEDTFIANLTASDAVNLLARSNPNNRNLKERKIRKYAAAMQSGKFPFTGEALIFTENGMLADGHNRLTALSRCDVNTVVSFAVSVGVQQDCIKYMDIGAKRSNSDITKMELGLSCPVARAAVGKVYAGLVTGTELTEFYELENYIGSNYVDRVIPAYERCKKPNNLKHPAAIAGVYAWALYEAARRNGDTAQIEDFFTRLIDGVGIENPAEPAAALRTRLQGNSHFGNDTGVAVRNGVVTALKWFIEGRKTARGLAKAMYPEGGKS